MSHTHASLLVHVVFSTKGREAVIAPEIRERLFAYVGGVARNEGAALVSAGGVADHLHLLLSASPAKSVSGLVRDIKANSSRWIRETFPESQGFAWQAGYGAFSVSESNADAVRAYIERQEEHHRRVTFQEEYLEFLKRHRIEFDPKWVFD